MNGPWFQLDGTWHNSVPRKVGALHLQYSNSGAALCNPAKSVLLMDDGGYSEQEAAESYRTLCRRCLKAAGSRP